MPLFLSSTLLAVLLFFQTAAGSTDHLHNQEEGDTVEIPMILVDSPASDRGQMTVEKVDHPDTVSAKSSRESGQHAELEGIRHQSVAGKSDEHIFFLTLEHNGTVMAGRTVRWHLTSPDGSQSQIGTLTDKKGQSWVRATALGAEWVLVTAEAFNGKKWRATFELQASGPVHASNPGTPRHKTTTTGRWSMRGAKSTPIFRGAYAGLALKVQVKRNGQIAPNAVVQWRVTGKGARLSAHKTVTNTRGVSQTKLTAPRKSAASIVAEGPGGTRLATRIQF